MSLSCPDSWKNFKGVILDLDGTLYNQKRLRVRMAAELFRFYSLRPWRWRELYILFSFRRLRELLAETGQGDISLLQFKLTAEKCHCSIKLVEFVIDEWLHRRPLRHLASCRYPLVDELVDCLLMNKLQIAVLSDYPPEAKLRALNLEKIDSWASTDRCIDRLKPDPAGVLHISRFWGVSPGQCLVIGDRDDRDGEAARRGGMRYLILPDGFKFSSLGQLWSEAADVYRNPQ